MLIKPQKACRREPTIHIPRLFRGRQHEPASRQHRKKKVSETSGSSEGLPQRGEGPFCGRRSLAELITIRVLEPRVCLCVFPQSKPSTPKDLDDLRGSPTPSTLHSPKPQRWKFVSGNSAHRREDVPSGLWGWAHVFLRRGLSGECGLHWPSILRRLEPRPGKVRETPATHNPGTLEAWSLSPMN